MGRPLIRGSMDEFNDLPAKKRSILGHNQPQIANDTLSTVYECVCVNVKCCKVR